MNNVLNNWLYKINLYFIISLITFFVANCSCSAKPEDKNKSVYWHNQEVIEADYQTWSKIDDIYSKDKNNIYWTFLPLTPPANLDTFEVLGDGYAKDKDHVYRYGEIQEGLDPETF